MPDSTPVGGDAPLLTPSLAPHAKPLTEDTLWIIRRGEQEFRTPALEELIRWAGEGRVLGSDLIFHAAVGRWVVARHVPQIADLFPPERTSRRALKPLLLVVGLLVLLPLTAVATCAGVGLLGAAAEAVKPTQAEVKLQVYNETLAKGEIRNVGSNVLRDVRLVFEWTNSSGKVMATVDAGTIPALKPGAAVDLEVAPEANEKALTRLPPQSSDSYEAAVRHQKALRAAEMVDRVNIASAFSKSPRLRVYSKGDEVKAKLVDVTSYSAFDAAAVRSQIKRQQDAE